MTDVHSEVAAVAERICEARDGLDSRRAVQLRSVEPLFEALGWDVRSTEVEPDASVEGRDVDYLLRVDDRPVVAVLTAPPEDGGLDEAHERHLAATLERGPPDWGLVTDGWHLALLARADGELHRRRLSVSDLREAPSALDDFARAAAAERAASRTDVRDARLRLARHREEAVEAIVDEVVAQGGEPLRDRAREAAADLVDDLAASDAGYEADNRDESDHRDESDAPDEADDGAPVEAAVDAAVSSPSGTGAGAANAAATSEPSSNEPSSSGDEPDRVPSQSAGRPSEAVDEDASLPDAREGEYVVRFFGGRSSVGAIGADAPGATLAGVVEFLVENHDLAASVELPWGVEDGRATLAPAPTHPDGTEMRAHRELEGDWYVWTGGGATWARAAIADLADAVGLRAMFQGDW